jgi:hypothetical protein
LEAQAGLLPSPVVQAVMRKGELLLSWTAIPEAVDYVVECATLSDTEWSMLAATPIRHHAMPICGSRLLIRVRARR